MKKLTTERFHHVVREVLNLFTTRKYWARANFAVDSQGFATRIKAEAVRWCMAGAVSKFSLNSEESVQIIKMLRKIAWTTVFIERPAKGIAHVIDNLEYSVVRKLLTKSLICTV